jgi:arylsulfatase A-like enzyme
MRTPRIKRRDFLKAAAAGAVGVVLPSAMRDTLARLPSGGLAESDSRGKPNIVYILADDLGYGDVRRLNPEGKIPTPNIDRLASEGMLFTDAHSGSAVCTPTRYGLLTGRYCWRSPLQRGVLEPWGETLIAPDRLTVASLLKQNGYATACIGKWHLGWKWPTKDGKPPAAGADRLSNVDFSGPIPEGPTSRGFDYYFGTDLPNYPPYCYIENDRTVGIPSVPNRPEFNRPGPMLPGWDRLSIMPDLTRRAVKYIEDSTAVPPGMAGATSPRKPFFLYFALTAPHYPVVPAPEFRGKSKAGEYGDFVVHVDWTVGQVMEALRRSGQAENTLVIFTSDNGPEITGEVKPGAYDRIRLYRHYSMGLLRGAKRDAWEGGHRVPFIARWPGKIQAGSLSSETICHVDFMATAAALLGVKLPENAGEDSYNILPALFGQKLDAPIREATVHHSAKGHFAIRKDNWVLIDSATGDDNKEPDWFRKQRGYEPHNQPCELYDLSQDLAERRNLCTARPEKVWELKDLLEKYKQEGRSTPGPPQKNDVPLRSNR